MSIEEVEKLNPHFKWDGRKQKRLVMSRAKKLANGTYAVGCRGHPGIIQNKVIRRGDILGSDLDVVSLMDGLEGSCSIYHCCPDPISKEWALWLSEPFNYESDLLNRAIWWLYNFNDFDEHYTKEQHIGSYTEYRLKVDKLFLIAKNEENFAVIESLQNAFDTLISGGKPGAIDLGYHGETFRYHRGVRKEDFASQLEIDTLLELGNINYQNKTSYPKLHERD